MVRNLSKVVFVLCVAWGAVLALPAAYVRSQGDARLTSAEVAARVTCGQASYLFPSIKEALESELAAGARVELLRDDALDASMTVYDYRRPMTLDLGGHTLSLKKRWLICCNMTVTNGVIVSEGQGLRPLLASHTVTFRHVNIVSGVGCDAFVSSLGNIFLEEGVTVCDDDSAAIHPSAVSSVVVRGGKFKGKVHSDLAFIEKREGYSVRWSAPDAEGFVSPEWIRNEFVEEALSRRRALHFLSESVILTDNEQEVVDC